MFSPRTFTTEILELDGEFSRGPDMSGADYETCAFEFEPGVLFVSGGQVFGVHTSKKILLFRLYLLHFFPLLHSPQHTFWTLRQENPPNW